MRRITAFTAVVVCIAACFCLTGCGEPSPEEQAAQAAAAAKSEADNEQSMSFYMSQDFVEKRLKSPGSAKFPSSSEAKITKIGDHKYRVISYVDSQNSFGALMRSDYGCELTKIDGDNWRCDELELKQRE